MRITDFVLGVRDELDDSQSLKWSDAEIVRHADAQAKRMIVMLTKADKEWHNFSYCLQKESGKNLFANVWEWRLPSWVEKVRKVYARSGSASVEATFSPYRWTGSSAVDLGQEINETDVSRRSGWSWQGQHTLRLWNWTQADELTLQVVKLPPPMFKATTANLHASVTFDGIYLPSSLTLGTLGMEEGIYANAEVLISATASATDTNLGEMRRVDYSRTNAMDVGTRRTEIRFEEGFLHAVAVGDTLETLIPIPPSHARFLTLLVVNACAIKKNNLDLQKSIVGDLGQATNEFLSDVAARDSAGPYFYKAGQSLRRRYSPDIRNSPYPWPWGA